MDCRTIGETAVARALSRRLTVSPSSIPPFFRVWPAVAAPLAPYQQPVTVSLAASRPCGMSPPCQRPSWKCLKNCGDLSLSPMSLPLSPGCLKTEQRTRSNWTRTTRFSGRCTRPLRSGIGVSTGSGQLPTGPSPSSPTLGLTHHSEAPARPNTLVPWRPPPFLKLTACQRLFVLPFLFVLRLDSQTLSVVH